MRFTQAYAAAPVCSPTRASILTGRHTPRHGVTAHIPGHWRPYARLADPDNRQQHLPGDAVTIAQLLGPAGYGTAYYGKWHLGRPDFYPGRFGFDEWAVHRGAHIDFRLNSNRAVPIPEGAFLEEVLTDLSLDFIQRHRDRPFFLYLSHYAVHVPLEAREELIEKYTRKPGPPGRPNNPVYAAQIEQVDAAVGRLLEKLGELELEENTVVIFYSDNGGLARRFDKEAVAPRYSEANVVTTNAPLRDEKGSLYEGGIRVPLIVRWRGRVEPGSVCDTPSRVWTFCPRSCGWRGFPSRLPALWTGSAS